MNNKNYNRSRIKKMFLLVFVGFLLFSMVPQPAKAMPVEDFTAHFLKMMQNIQDKTKDLKEEGESKFRTIMKKIGSSIYQSLLSTALNGVAYESAVYVGSGLEGQKPMFLTEDWDKYLDNIGDQVAGEYIEKLSDMMGTSSVSNKKFNFCEPSFNTKFKIGLGLIKDQKPSSNTPDCTWSEMKNAWKTEGERIAALGADDYLKKLSGSFDMNSSEIGIALTLHTGIMEDMTAKESIKKTELQSKQGWFDARDIGGGAKAPPGKGKEEDRSAAEIMRQKISTTVTGDILVDAMNIFVNQLAATGFQTAMKKLTSKTNPVSHEYTGDYGGLLDYESGPYTSGISGAKQGLRGIIEPKFNVRGDYDILAELSSCNISGSSVGTTNCVIDDRFRMAIQEKKTVGEAIKEGIFEKKTPFGFKMVGKSAEEPKYNEGIPYRSMLILRKFRILPVGWEMAAEYIRNSPVAIRNATLGKMVECYSNNDEFDGYYAEWCRGLVDPNWVLKAPQNYCAKEGYGPEILLAQEIQGFDEGVGEENVFKESQYIVSRNDNYCADEQSCISERDDGSCEYFGYCTEERRKWDFSADSCEPIFNTCQSFSTEKGKTISYLKNTLDFCDKSQYGCEKYAIPSVKGYSSIENELDWGVSNEFIYLNKESGECTQKEEGCSEFIRIKDGLGSNLIYNSNFSDDEVGDDNIELVGHYLPQQTKTDFVNDWPVSANGKIVDDAPSRNNNNVLMISGNNIASLYSFDHSSTNNSEKSILPQGFVFEPEVNYTISADIYLKSGAKAGISIGRNNGKDEKLEITSSGDWERLTLSVYNNSELNANQFRIYAEDAGAVEAYIDNIKLEIGSNGTPYDKYRSSGLVYQKIIPDYMEDACYEDAKKDDYQIASDAPAECTVYGNKCSAKEAGCQLYTNIFDNISIPAKVSAKDYCDSSCVGYDMYIKSANNFSQAKDKYFIPSTAIECNAAAVGCEEFTNLDSLGSGGEQKEYFSYLRQCVKPDELGSDCAEFYTWEGNSEKGQQLIKFSLKEDASGGPAITANDSSECNKDIFDLPHYDASYNPDCRNFYNREGEVFYHLYSRTISCSDDCHPYRMSYKNVNELFSRGVCELLIKSGIDALYFDADTDNCYQCENGGYFNTEHMACIYNALPEESIRCSSDSSGCGEYNGSGGTNIESIINSTFEDDVLDGWGDADDIEFVSESAISGGKSISATKTIINEIGYIEAGTHYVISFMAKGYNQDVSLRVSLGNKSFGAVDVKANKWGIFKLDLSIPDEADLEDAELTIANDSGAQVYYDNIRLYKVDDRHYLIRDSWNTPAVCDMDLNNNPYPLYALGCSVYEDGLGENHFLHSFTSICPESAVGCEAVIDTDNYSQPDALEEVLGKIVNVKADRVRYIVFDTDKMCDQANKGCERLGEAYEYSDTTLYTDEYILNNPDKYEQILCDEEGVGCDKWGSAEGDFYFKDPGDMVCEYRQAGGTGSSGFDWFKKKINRCGASGDVCLSDNDCEDDVKCTEESVDTPCPTSGLKTFGLGGVGNDIKQPVSQGGSNWAGFCPLAESGCTEYIDPVSDFSANLIFNADFSQDLSDGSLADGWELNKDKKFQQTVELEGNNAYIVAVEGYNTADITTESATLYELGDDNELKEIDTVFVEEGENKMFYIGKNARVKLVVNNAKPREDNKSKIILKKAIIDYQLIAEIDTTSCIAKSDSSNGCIDFNQRAIEGASGYSKLNKNAWDVNDKNSFNSNQIIKVRPDRVCNSWLACKSYVNDEDGNNVCFDIGTCNSLDQNGNCANFEIFDESEDYYEYNPPVNGSENSVNIEKFKNLSGYAKAGSNYYNAYDKKVPNNLFDFGYMEQKGQNVFVPNGGFEMYDPKTKVVNAWSPNDPTELTSSFGVISSLKPAQDEGIDYPMIGKSFLRYDAGNSSSFPLSGDIKIAPGIYYLSFYINTNNLGGGSASVKIVSDDNNIHEITPAKSSDGWRLMVEKFEIDPTDGDSIKIRLGANDGSTQNQANGNIYIDDIKISPVLLVKGDHEDEDDKDEDTDFYVRQSCRLYPEEDSLSCDYFDESGIIKSGDRGYCLEYDRFPGNPEACLLWWPVDKVMGAGIQTGVHGYNERAPLYYCIGAPPEADTRPYIDAESVKFIVDEAMYIVLNGERLNGAFSETDDHGSTIKEDEEISNNWVGMYNKDKFNEGMLTTGFLVGMFSGDALSTIGTAIVGSIFPNYVHNFQQGSLSTFLREDLKREDNKIYLNYGVNEIKVGLRSRHDGGVTFLLMAGEFYYYDKYYNLKKGTFNLTDEGANSTKNIVKVAFEENPGIKQHTCFLRQSNITAMKEWVVPNILGGGKLSDYVGDDANRKDFKRDYIVTNEEDDDDCMDGGAGVEETIAITIDIPSTYPCTKLVQVVTADGRNKAWANRVKQGTSYTPKCNEDLPEYIKEYFNLEGKKMDTRMSVPSSTCSYLDDYKLFGSVVPPDKDNNLNFLASPVNWADELNGPLYYELPNEKDPQARMGQLYSTTSISYFFAESYGIWEWEDDNDTNDDVGGYVFDKKGWTGSDEWCGALKDSDGNEYNTGNNKRPGINTDCVVAPEISNIKLNGTKNAYVFGQGFIDLSFNSDVDGEQMPMVSYEVDWGDGEVLSVSGVEMRDRPEGSRPHTVFHSYDYWSLKNKEREGLPMLSCNEGNVDSKPSCTVIPRVKIQDNWGWCSEARDKVPCPSGKLERKCMDSRRDIDASIDSCINNLECTNSNYPTCSDGWEEASGEIIVYE